MSAAGELDGRVILLTGASRGIGSAVATACARAGATMLLAGRDVRALERLADVLEGAGATPPVLVPINLETAGVDDYSVVAELIAARFGRLDGFVANAAMLGEPAPLANYDGVAWARTFQVNVHSVFLLLQTCLPLFRSAVDPAVVFSLAAEGLEARPNWGAYAVSKYAVRGLMELLAAESRHTSLRVNGVVPEAVRTRLRRQAFPGLDADTLPLPETQADAYVALLGPRGAGVRGRCIAVAGGSFRL